MKKMITGMFLLASFSCLALDCPNGSFLVKNVEAYELDYREIWGESYELSVIGNSASTPKNFSAALVIEDENVLLKAGKLKLPTKIKELCVEQRDSDLEAGVEKLVLTKF